MIGYIRDATMLFLASLHSSVDRAVGFYPIGRGFESFWGRKNNPPELVLYQHQAGFYLLVLLVIRRIRTQVAVNHVDDLFDRFLV